jgi:hypothetical protein
MDLEYLILNNFNPLYANEIPLNANPLGNYLLDHYKEDRVSNFKGAVAIEKEKGKVLWFGFQLAQISLDRENRSFFDQIIINAINWLAGNPLIWVNRFPKFYSSATLFSVWINNINTTLNKELPIYKKLNVPLNFFISPLEIKKSFEEVYKLSSVGSLNLFFDYFKYLNSDTTQIQMVCEESSEILKAGSRQEYFGVQTFNLPELHIYNSLLKNNFDYFLNPELSFLFIKGQEDENELYGVKTNYINNPVDLVEGSIKNDSQKDNDLYKNLSKTGSIISHIIMDNLTFNLNRTIEEKLKFIINSSMLNNSYITTYPDLINWIKTKNSIEVNIFDVKDEEIIKVEIKNVGNAIAEQIGINLSIPSRCRNPKLAVNNFELNYNIETGYYNLFIPFLHSEQELNLEIEYRK